MEPERKFCPVCTTQNLKSSVWNRNPNVKSILIKEDYWDEDGYRHYHEGYQDENTLFCSQGHMWTETTLRGSGNCPRCQQEWVTRRYDSTGVKPGEIIISKVVDSKDPPNVDPVDKLPAEDKDVKDAPPTPPSKEDPPTEKPTK